MPSYSRTVQIPGKSSQELYDKVSGDIDRFMEKAGVGKVEIERNAAKKQLNIKSSMFSATLSCLEGSIGLDGKLSLLATPFKSKIDEGINRWLSKTFNISA
jgi:protein involved in ribonucleotide reduction